MWGLAFQHDVALGAISDRRSCNGCDIHPILSPYEPWIATTGADITEAWPDHLKVSVRSVIPSYVSLFPPNLQS
jgi:hypothetical protein